MLSRGRGLQWRALLLVASAGVVALMFSSGAAEAATTTASFTTAGCSPWSVPTGVSSVQIQATGAAGQADSRGAGTGGTGDGVSATLSGLSGGESLFVCVDTGGGSGAGRFTSGSNGGNGGGASGVAIGSDFAAPVLVAAGGGGGFAEDSGGGAGDPSGAAGGAGGAGDGGGATQTTFGSGGATTCGPCDSGSDGARFTSAGPGAGGGGGTGKVVGGGGGGGAGYYGGGGGGGDAGAGGGGSDFCTDTTTLTGCSVSSGAGTQSVAGNAAGDAEVVLTYTVPAAETSLVAAPQVVLFNRVRGVGLGVVQATLTSGGNPVSGQTVTFIEAGQTLCSAPTNASGVARCVLSPLRELLVLLRNQYTATYAANAAYAGATAHTQAIEIR